jgi:hypothetical protein
MIGCRQVQPEMVVLGGVILCGDSDEAEAYLSRHGPPRSRVNLADGGELVVFDVSPVEQTTILGVRPSGVSITKQNGCVMETSVSYHTGIEGHDNPNLSSVFSELVEKITAVNGEGVQKGSHAVTWITGKKRTDLKYLVLSDGFEELSLKFSCMKDSSNLEGVF